MNSKNVCDACHHCRHTVECLGGEYCYDCIEAAIDLLSECLDNIPKDHFHQLNLQFANPKEQLKGNN